MLYYVQIVKKNIVIILTTFDESIIEVYCTLVDYVLDFHVDLKAHQ